MNGWNRSHRNHGFSAKRKFKSGCLVPLEGMYSDEWGESLLLVEGDVFPTHPHMGDTCWTYAGPFVIRPPGSLKRSGPRTSSRGIGYTK